MPDDSQEPASRYRGTDQLIGFGVTPAALGIPAVLRKLLSNYSTEPVSPSFDRRESAPDPSRLAFGDRVVQALLAYRTTGTDRLGLSGRLSLVEEEHFSASATCGLCEPLRGGHVGQSRAAVMDALWWVV